MTIAAEIIADSISEAGARLTTYRLKYPRFIHSEVMTHRAFSRNASSSRAIPLRKMIECVAEEPAVPIHWGRNQSGMQAREELPPPKVSMCRSEWMWARDDAVYRARTLHLQGLHKQVASRILEPFAHINVVLTSCPPGLHNFFRQRVHADAQPEMCRLAVAMARAYRDSTPVPVPLGGWHLPFVAEDEAGLPLADRIAVSVARCARVSYLAHDGRPTSLADDLDLAGRLIGAEPPHLSPAEHQAEPTVDPQKWSGNLVGWSQYRKSIEPRPEPFDFSALEAFA